MATSASKWMRGDYFLLDTAEYQPASDQILVRFRNGDQVLVSIAELWGDRRGQANWRLIQVDPETQGAVLVPTLSGQPTIEGDVAEIPGDVIRAATDPDFRAYIESLAKRTA